MKKLLILSLVFVFWSCSNQDDATIPEIDVVSIPEDTEENVELHKFKVVHTQTGYTEMLNCVMNVTAQNADIIDSNSKEIIKTIIQARNRSQSKNF